jgi:hypothetical protein
LIYFRNKCFLVSHINMLTMPVMCKSWAIATVNYGRKDDFIRFLSILKNDITISKNAVSSILIEELLPV